MKFSSEKAKELTSNPEFMKKLSVSYNDETKFIQLFKEYGVELSSEDYKNFINCKNNIEQKISDDDLQNVSGGKLDLNNTLALAAGGALLATLSASIAAINSLGNDSDYYDDNDDNDYYD